LYATKFELYAVICCQLVTTEFHSTQELCIIDIVVNKLVQDPVIVQEFEDVFENTTVYWFGSVVRFIV
jgi:hypothetical protein